MKRLSLTSLLNLAALATILLANCKKGDTTPTKQTGKFDVEFEHSMGEAWS